MMRRILCFGDSNTYGVRPNGGRFDEHTRWPMRLRDLLGDAYAVIEEGFGGRTTVFDDPVEGGYKSGAAYLPPCLMSHNPLCAVLLMLGANDAKQRFHMTAHNIAQANMQLIRLIRAYACDEQGQPPKILLMSPPPLGEFLMETPMGLSFGPEAVGITRAFPGEFSKMARLMRCDFLDAGQHAAPARQDAVHMDQASHLRLAQAVYEKILEML